VQCGNCGATVSADDRFCSNCGQPVGDTAAPAAPVSTSPTAWGTPAAAPPPIPPPPPPPTQPPNGYAIPPNPYNAPPPNPYAPPPNPYATQPYGPYGGPNPYAQSGTNGFAIAAFVLGLVGWIPCAIGSVLAVIFGFVARHQIKTPGASGGKRGDGLAIAGIVLGFVAVAGWLLLMIISAATGGGSSSSY
jgi:hypothetical protein